MPSTHATMTAAEAAARLGIQRASLYAYVSRGVLNRQVADDGKTSLFAVTDVEALARRTRGRPPAGTVNVMLATSLTRIADDGVWFRGRPLAEIAGAWSFEETAEWLWSGAVAALDEDRAAARSAMWPSRVAGAVAPLVGLSPTAMLLHTLAVTGLDADSADPLALARGMITTFADAAALTPALARRRVPRQASIAERISVRFGRPELARTIDFILALMADHELASSTLAVRVAASTRADMPAAIAAGLATLSGRLHGGVTRHAAALIEEASATSAVEAIDRRLTAGERLPGFGHAVYRDIDPRAVLLFDHLDTAALPAGRLSVARELVDAARQRISARPNIDLALGSFTYAAELPVDAAEWLFAIARTAGWVAHAMEEYDERPLRFRPRSVYIRRE